MEGFFEGGDPSGLWLRGFVGRQVTTVPIASKRKRSMGEGEDARIESDGTGGIVESGVDHAVVAVTGAVQSLGGEGVKQVGNAVWGGLDGEVRERLSRRGGAGLEDEFRLRDLGHPAQFGFEEVGFLRQAMDVDSDPF
jgi:hypothetical protein